MDHFSPELSGSAYFSLQAIRQIPLVYYDIKAWENEHENVFSLFRQGALWGSGDQKLEIRLRGHFQVSLWQVVWTVSSPTSWKRLCTTIDKLKMHGSSCWRWDEGTRTDGSTSKNVLESWVPPTIGQSSWKVPGKSLRRGWNECTSTISVQLANFNRHIWNTWNYQLYNIVIYCNWWFNTFSDMFMILLHPSW